MMLELIILLSLVMFVLSVGLVLLKFVFAMVLLPVHLALWLTKGLFGLVILVPLMLLVGTVALAVVPFGLALCLLPVVIFGGVAAKLVAI